MHHDKRGRLVCACSGYWFPHRKGGGACEHSRTCNLHRARRTGDIGAVAEALWDMPAKPLPPDSSCPF